MIDIIYRCNASFGFIWMIWMETAPSNAELPLFFSWYQPASLCTVHWSKWENPPTVGGFPSINTLRQFIVLQPTFVHLHLNHLHALHVEDDANLSLCFASSPTVATLTFNFWCFRRKGCTRDDRRCLRRSCRLKPWQHLGRCFNGIPRVFFLGGELYSYRIIDSIIQQ